MTRSRNEHDSQVSVISWADTIAVKLWPQYAIDLEKIVRKRKVMVRIFPIFAIPNGGHRHIAVANQLRAEGVRSGVPDLFLPIPVDGYCGLIIEMKTTKGKPSKNQLTWINLMNSGGYATTICHSSRDAIVKITAYLNGQWATLARNVD